MARNGGKIGERFGRLVILEYSPKNKKYNCLCDCGNKKMISLGNLRNGSIKSCGCLKKENDTPSLSEGDVFGKWTVISYSGKSQYLCKCECGVEKNVYIGRLNNGMSKSCGGCSKIKNGDMFGEWVFLEYVSKDKGKCLCSCGQEKIVYVKTLRDGTSKSCGCTRLLKEGDVFGRLTILSYVGKEKYLCLCECGTEKIISSGDIRSGSTKSCGCLGSEMASLRASRNIKKFCNARHGYNWYLIDGEAEVKCRSSYEVFIWNYYKYSVEESILYEPKTIRVSENRRYTPDFYLPEKDIWLEPKGSFKMSEKKSFQKESIEKLIKDGYKINVLFWKDIVALCGLKFNSLTTYFRQAGRINVPVEDYLAKMMYLEAIDGRKSRHSLSE